ICSRVRSSFHQLSNCSSVGLSLTVIIVVSNLTSIDDLIKRCSARLYLQRCCAADRGGNTYQHDSSAVRSIRFTTLFAVVLIYSLTTYFAAVCCRSQR